MSTRSLNKVMIIGNLTRDAELRYTPQGTAVCTFGVATNRQWTPSDGGERQEDVEFHRVVAWAKLAEICSQLLHKGRKVYVEGRLQTRTWSGQDGQERTTTEVVIDSMIALGPPKASMGEDVAGFSEGAQMSGAPSDQPSDTTQIADTDEVEIKEEEAAQPEEKEEKPEKKKTKAKKTADKGKSSEGKQEEVSEDDIPF